MTLGKCLTTGKGERKGEKRGKGEKEGKGATGDVAQGHLCKVWCRSCREGEKARMRCKCSELQDIPGGHYS